MKSQRRSLSDIAVRGKASVTRISSFAGGEFPSSRETLHDSCFTDSENDADGRGSLTAVERSMSNRLPGI